MPNYNNNHELDIQETPEIKINSSIHEEEKMMDIKNIDVNQKLFLELLISICKNQSKKNNRKEDK